MKIKTAHTTTARVSALSIGVAIALSSSSWAVAQETDETAAGAAIEEVVVTGSRLKRTVRDASVPVASVDDEDIRLSGTVNVEDLLNSMPQFVAGTTGASNGLTFPTGTGAATLNLRGLGPTRNLVLVNGKRYAFFDSRQITDINTIPAALIQRTEVVTGGASAVYGSDAIGGVVNFIMRDDFEGVEARLTGAINSEGDGFERDITLTMGGDFDGGRGNAVLSVGYFKRDSILTTDRTFSEVVIGDVTDANGNAVLGVGGSSFVPNGRFTGIPSTPAAIAAIPGLDAALDAAGLNGLGGTGFISGDSGMDQRPISFPGDRFNYTLDNFLQIPQERWTINAMTHYDLTDSATLYLDGMFANNETTVGFASAFINQSYQIEVNNPFIGQPLRDVFQLLDAAEAGPGANDGIITLGINRRMLEVGPRRNQDSRQTFRVLTGVRGELGDLGENSFKNVSYDVYYSYTQTENTVVQLGNVLKERVRVGLLSGSAPNGDPIVNPFGPNISQAGVDFISVVSSNIDRTNMQVLAANLTGELFEMPAGPLAASIGTEFRSNEAVFIPDQLVANGDIAGFNAITPTDGEIDVWEIYGEVRVPILSDVPLAETLSVNAAVRSSDYDLESVGSVTTYLGGIDWQLNSQIAFGGQFQRAIRAPNVGEVFGGQNSFPIFATDPCASAGAENDPTLVTLCQASGVPAGLVGTGNVLQPNNEIPGVFGGNPDLDEEESDTITLGVVFTPDALPKLRIALDYFDIEVENAVAPFAGGVNNILDLCFVQIQDINSTACQAISRNPTTGIIDVENPVVALNANIGLLETSGFDIQVDYNWDAGFGWFGGGSNFALSFRSTFVDEFTLTPIADIPQNKNFCVGAFGPTCGEPKHELKTTTRLTWTTGPLSISARHRWLDESALDRFVLPRRAGDPNPPAANTFAVTEFDTANYVDLTFNYEASDGVSIWGGINNVFDEDPPILGRNQSRANTFPDTYDPYGTQFFLGTAVRF
jgi:outer membrane receptor protein involved in Fe transport